MGVVLGQGAYSVVKLGQRVSDKRKVAVKIVRRTKLKKQDEYALRQEVDLLVALKHPNIVEAIDFFEDEQYFYLVLEYLPGGELFDRLIHKEYYNENDAREAVTKLLNALQYCHAKGIIHR